MTNYEAIKRMTMEQLEIFLDHVYLTGMNNALYLSRLSADEAADFHYETYDHPWLASDAEEATEYVFDDDGETFMPHYLVKAIYRNAGIDMDEQENAEDDVSVKYESTVEQRTKFVVGESAPKLNLEGMPLGDLKMLLKYYIEQIEDAIELLE